MAASEYADLIARNIRAERARRHLEQRDVVERMRALGFSNWHRQTLGKVERGERRLFADELFALSLALEVDLQTLLLPTGEDRRLKLPSGHVFLIPGRSWEHEPSVPGFWDGNEPEPPPEAGAA